MLTHFRSFDVNSVYCGVCFVTGWIASGPYSGSCVPATWANLGRSVRGIVGACGTAATYCCLNQFMLAQYNTV
jgi:hypothetical protein